MLFPCYTSYFTVCICFVFQYFDSLNGVPIEDLPYYGGSVEIADYCPFSQEFSWHLSGEFQRSSDCRILENQPGEFPLKYVFNMWSFVAGSQGWFYLDSYTSS